MAKAALQEEQAEDLDLELKRTQLAEAKLRLELTKRNLEEFEAAERERERNKRQTQFQLETETQNLRTTQEQCLHKQGAPCRRPLKGTKESALRLIKLPDGFSMVIHCPICRMKVFSPHPDDRLTARREGETEAQMQARIAKFEADTARFRELLAVVESIEVGGDAVELDTGTEVTFRNARTGNPIYPRRAWDQQTAPVFHA